MSFYYAGIAQLAEQLSCKQKVESSKLSIGFKVGDIMAKKATNSKTKDKKQAIDVNVLEEEKDVKKADLLPVNPLLGSQAISVADETEQKVAMINEIESLTELNKQQLSIKRQKVEMEVDNRKLDTALKTISTVDKIIQSVANEEVLDRVAANIVTPQDMKYMAEAAEKLTGTLRNLMNPNVIDEFGTKKRTKINFMFKSSGAVQAAVQVDTSND